MKKDAINLTPEEEMQVIIDKAKKKYGKVYKTRIADEDIIWRRLKRSEYKQVMELVIEHEEIVKDEEGNEVVEMVYDEQATYELRQEKIADLVILYPENIVENMAIVADVISTECMIKSGFGEEPKTEEL